jgi:hypothetical protein
MTRGAICIHRNKLRQSHSKAFRLRPTNSEETRFSTALSLWPRALDKFRAKIADQALAAHWIHMAGAAGSIPAPPQFNRLDGLLGRMVAQRDHTVSSKTLGLSEYGPGVQPIHAQRKPRRKPGQALTAEPPDWAGTSTCASRLRIIINMARARAPACGSTPVPFGQLG